MSDQIKKQTPFIDLSKLGEDGRINAIGSFVMNTRASAWCLTDADPKSKVERYKDKMHAWFPLLELGEIKRDFPVKSVSGFEVRPPKEN